MTIITESKQEKTVDIIENTIVVKTEYFATFIKMPIVQHHLDKQSIPTQ
jgi:hypothetical protein